MENSKCIMCNYNPVLYKGGEFCYGCSCKTCKIHPQIEYCKNRKNNLGKIYYECVSPQQCLNCQKKMRCVTYSTHEKKFMHYEELLKRGFYLNPKYEEYLQKNNIVFDDFKK